MAIKPDFPSITPANLKEGLDKLQDKAEALKNDDGSLSLRKLETAVEKSNDPKMRVAFDVVKDEFVTEKTVRVSGGCGGSYTETRRKVPSKLDEGEVMSVMRALTRAQNRINDLDKDGNVVIDKSEALASTKMGGFSGKLVQAAVAAEVQDYVRELSRWSASLASATRTVEGRQEIDQDIDTLVGYHCKYKNGGRAVAWALREFATRFNRMNDPTHRGAKALAAAETDLDDNPMVRYFGGRSVDPGSLAKGHLDNHEVRDMLNVQDLGAFEKKMKQQVAKNVGMSFSEYLKGADLEEADQLKDPDVVNPPKFPETPPSYDDFERRGSSGGGGCS